MDSNAVTVGGPGLNATDDECMLECLPEMRNVYSEHFGPFQDKLSSVLQHSRSHFRALVGSESFAGFLNVPLMSDALVKTVEVMFEAAKPRVLQLRNDEVNANIHWLDVIKESDYQAEYKGNGIYHFHMRDRGAIVQLSAFQHNMILSGLPRKLVQPWSYEKDVRTELNTLALAAEMTSLMNKLASEIIKVNNTVLEEILKRDRILRRKPEPSQRLRGSPFPLESAEEPAQFTPAQIDADSPYGMAIETQRTDVQASASKRGAGTRNFAKNRAWPAEVLKQLPLWFEDQVRQNLSQEEIAQNFHRKFKQKRTFQAIEAKVYFLTGKSPFRRRNKKSSRKEPVSLTPRSSPPLSQPFESVELTQQLISKSNIEVDALRLAPNLLPYLNSDYSEDGSLYALHDVQPVDRESESSNPHAVPEQVPEQDTGNQMSSCRYASQEHEVLPGTSQHERPVRGSPRAEESPKAHPASSDLVPENQPRNDNSSNVHATTLGTVDSYLPPGSPLESPRISEPIQYPIRHHSEGDTTHEEVGQTLIHGTESSVMDVEQTDTAHCEQSPERHSPQSLPHEILLDRGSANEGSNNENHTESGPDASPFPRAPTPFQVPEPRSIGNLTELPQNSGMDAPTANISERALIDEELIMRYLHEKSQARFHRPWNVKDLNRLPEWLMKRKDLPKERLEVEFLGDFGHYRTFSAIVAACRKKRKADSRHKQVTSAPTPGHLAPVVPAVLDTMRVSRSPNAIIGSDARNLDPSHTITVPSNENTLRHPPLERLGSPQRNQLQVLDNTARLSRNSPPPLHDGEETVDQNPPAAVASECASEQLVLSTLLETVEGTSTSGNRRHRVEIMPKPLARFTAINGGNVHPTNPNVSEMNPLVQMESTERGTLPDRQESQQTSMERIVEQRRNDQNTSRKDGPQSGRGRPNQFTSEHAQAGSDYLELSTGTPEGAGNQQSLSIGTSGANIPQLGTSPNLQNNQPTSIQISVPNCPSDSQVSNPRPPHFCTPDSQSRISKTSSVPGRAHTGAVVPISVSSSFQSSPTSLPHFPLHELKGRGAERYQGPTLPSLAPQMYNRRAGEPLHR